MAPGKKKKERRKNEEKNRNTQAYGEGCSSEEKNRNSKLAETFKERSKEKVWTIKCQLWSTLRGGGAANTFLEVEHLHCMLILFTFFYLLYWSILPPKQETPWLGKNIKDIIMG